MLTWAFDAAPRQTGLEQPIARSLSMACPRLEPSAPSPGDGDAAGSILARSQVLAASSNKLMPSIQLRVLRRRTVLAGWRDWMSSEPSPKWVAKGGEPIPALRGIHGGHAQAASYLACMWIRIWDLRIGSPLRRNQPTAPLLRERSTPLRWNRRVRASHSARLE